MRYQAAIARHGLLLFVSVLFAARATAELRIDITQGVVHPIPVAIVPFAQSAEAALDLASVVQADLASSGRFQPMARSVMTSRPAQPAQVQAADWRAAGNDYVVVGRVAAAAGGWQIDTDLVNVLTGRVSAGPRLTATTATLRNAAHRVSDFVFEKIIGTRGAFATSIAYVAVDGVAPSQHFRLLVADADGDNARIILDSRQPVMSPAWSADGAWLAYVSFENNASAVYVQRVATGERRRVSARAGVNGAPAWSPDGRRLALTLSGSGGNLDIYVLDLATQGLTRVTDDPAIETEPAWSADGVTLYFTSDRSGGPQIYSAPLDSTRRVQRQSFGFNYAARARLSPDGRLLAYSVRTDSGFHLAVQTLANGSVQVLTRGALDESPSFAPNGMSLIYASRQDGQGALATVAVDGTVSQRLRSDKGEVREPVWGPFLP